MNRTLALTFAALVLLGAGAGGGYWVATRHMAMQAPGETDAPPPGKKILYWHDPMYPQHKFDKPGKSPFMDMMLEPVYGDPAADTSGVTISPRVAQNLGVRTARVTSGTLTRKIEAAGSVAFDERAVAVVQSRTNGYIEKLFVRAPLDPVTKGQALAQVFVPEWASAQEEYLALRRSTLPAAQELARASRNRLTLLSMPESIIEAVERSGQAISRVTLAAPIGGVVGEISAREGMNVMPGATLFRINGLANVWINADVPEVQSASLKPGTVVKVQVAAYPGDVFKGKLAAILPEVNATTRTLKTRIEVANPDDRLKPGMFASVAFLPTARGETLLVPSEALIATGERNVVMVAMGDGTFVPVDVQTGIEANGQTEIKAGLKAGQEVVVSSQFLLDSEASLRGATNRMSTGTQDKGAAPAPATAPAQHDHAHHDTAPRKEGSK